jgi:hypothetical protein
MEVAQVIETALASLPIVALARYYLAWRLAKMASENGQRVTISGINPTAVRVEFDGRKQVVEDNPKAAPEERPATTELQQGSSNSTQNGRNKARRKARRSDRSDQYDQQPNSSSDGHARKPNQNRSENAGQS